MSSASLSPSSSALVPDPEAHSVAWSSSEKLDVMGVEAYVWISRSLSSPPQMRSWSTKWPAPLLIDPEASTGPLEWMLNIFTLGGGGPSRNYGWGSRWQFSSLPLLFGCRYREAAIYLVSSNLAYCRSCKMGDIFLKFWVTRCAIFGYSLMMISLHSEQRFGQYGIVGISFQ